MGFIQHVDTLLKHPESQTPSWLQQNELSNSIDQEVASLVNQITSQDNLTIIENIKSILNRFSNAWENQQEPIPLNLHKEPYILTLHCSFIHHLSKKFPKLNDFFKERGKALTITAVNQIFLEKLKKKNRQLAVFSFENPFDLAAKLQSLKNTHSKGTYLFLTQFHEGWFSHFHTTGVVAKKNEEMWRIAICDSQGSANNVPLDEVKSNISEVFDENEEINFTYFSPPRQSDESSCPLFVINDLIHLQETQLLDKTYLPPKCLKLCQISSTVNQYLRSFPKEANVPINKNKDTLKEYIEKNSINIQYIANSKTLDKKANLVTTRKLIKIKSQLVIDILNS